jgi:hypothetical protein
VRPRRARPTKMPATKLLQIKVGPIKVRQIRVRQIQGAAEQGRANRGIQIELYSDNWRFASKGQHSESGDWRRIEIYFRPADYNPMVEVSCRFLGTPGTSPVVASLRNMRNVRLQGPPPANKARFDMQKKQQQRLKLRHGRRSPLSNLALVFVPVAMLVCGHELR